jgi:hypothetical protein
MKWMRARRLCWQICMLLDARKLIGNFYHVLCSVLTGKLAIVTDFMLHRKNEGDPVTRVFFAGRPEKVVCGEDL